MTAFLIALIGFTTLAAFYLVPNDIYERDVYHSVARGAAKDSKDRISGCQRGGISPAIWVAKGTFLL